MKLTAALLALLVLAGCAKPQASMSTSIRNVTPTAATN